MQNGVLRNVTELTGDARHAMESLLGRSLREDEAIAINVYKPAPTGLASQRLRERIDKTAEKVLGIPEQEIDAVIDEAADHVRHHPE